MCVSVWMMKRWDKTVATLKKELDDFWHVNYIFFAFKFLQFFFLLRIFNKKKKKQIRKHGVIICLLSNFLFDIFPIDFEV